MSGFLRPSIFYFARHCESKWNGASKEQKATGEGLRDAALSDLGLLQAAIIEKELGKVEELKKVTLIMSSPLSRALHTAKSISTALGGVPITVVSALREVRRDVSDLGSPPTELLKEFSAAQFRGIEKLEPEWWLSPRTSIGCDCKVTYECGPCVTSRLFEVRNLVSRLPEGAVPLLVSHHDFIQGFIDRKVRNGEVMRVEP